jgi:predicted enzyme related to lactoylglutathione lyase
MAQTMSITSAFGAVPLGSSMASVPTTRPVASLEAALRDVRRDGGSVTSEMRTAPGIGSWVFVTDGHGREAVLWEDAAAIGR